MNYIKLKNFCSLEDIIKQVKRHPQNEKKIYYIYIHTQTYAYVYTYIYIYMTKVSYPENINNSCKSILKR